MSFVIFFIVSPTSPLRFLLDVNDMNSRTNVLYGQEGDVVIFSFIKTYVFEQRRFHTDESRYPEKKRFYPPSAGWIPARRPEWLVFI